MVETVRGQAEAARQGLPGLRRVVQQPRQIGQLGFERRRQHRAAVDLDQVMAAATAETDAGRPVRVLFDVDLGPQAIAPLPVPDRFFDVATRKLSRIDAAQPAQRLRRRGDLEAELRIVLDVLKLAAAAAGVEGTGSFPPQRAG